MMIPRYSIYSFNSHLLGSEWVNIYTSSGDKSNGLENMTCRQHKMEGTVTSNSLRFCQEVSIRKITGNPSLLIKLYGLVHLSFQQIAPSFWMHAQSCPTLCNPMDCIPSDSSGLWDFANKSTEVGCHFLFRGSSQPRDQACISWLLHWQADSLSLVPSGKPK